MNRRSLLATSAAGFAASAAIVPRAAAAEPSNRLKPIGEAKGIHPGRVVWVHDAEVTSWKGPDDGHWWADNRTRQQRVNAMMERAVCELTGGKSVAQAWDKLFRPWNNPQEKKYSRNLGLAKGIELVATHG